MVQSVKWVGWVVLALQQESLQLTQLMQIRVPVSTVMWADNQAEMCRGAESVCMCVCEQKRGNHCIAVIGDGAITGGMAYEAMNHAGFLDKNMIVILNDNQQVRDFSP